MNSKWFSVLASMVLLIAVFPVIVSAPEPPLRGTRAGGSSNAAMLTSGYWNYYWNESISDWTPIDPSAIINTTWNGYAWTNSELQYRPYFLEYIDQGDVYEFQANRSFTDSYNVFKYLVESMGYINDINDWEELDTVQTSRGWVNDSTIQYNNSFVTTQSNTTVVYYLESHRIREEKVLDSLPEAPQSWMGDKADIRLSYTGRIDIGSCNVWVDTDGDGILDAEFGTGETFGIKGRIVFTNSTNATQFVLPAPNVEDASGKTTMSNVTYNTTYHLKITGPNFYFYKEVPLLWLENATFPVRIDPSVVDSASSWDYATAARGCMQDSSGYYYVSWAESTGDIKLSRSTTPNKIDAWDAEVTLLGGGGTQVIDGDTPGYDYSMVIQNDEMYIVFTNASDGDDLHLSYCSDLSKYSLIDGWSGVADTGRMTDDLAANHMGSMGQRGIPSFDVDADNNIFVMYEASSDSDLWLVNYTTLGGWTSPVEVEDGITARHIHVIVDNEPMGGIVHVIYESGGNLYYKRSGDNGASWTDIAGGLDGEDTLTTFFDAAAVADERADIAYNSTGDLVVTWTYLVLATYTGIQFTTSLDDVWSGSAADIAAGSYHFKHPVIAGADGNDNWYFLYVEGGEEKLWSRKWDHDRNALKDSEVFATGSLSDEMYYPSVTYPIGSNDIIGVVLYNNITQNEIWAEAFPVEYDPPDEAVDWDSDNDSTENIGTNTGNFYEAQVKNNEYQSIEENMTAETFDNDAVDDNTGDVDSGGADKGTHSNFENEKLNDTNMDTLTEANQGGAAVDENLDVGTRDSTYENWQSRTGSTPYLDAADDTEAHDGSFIYEDKTDAMTEGWFDFDNTAETGTGFDVVLSLRIDSTDDDDQVLVYVDWTGVGGGALEATITYNNAGLTYTYFHYDFPAQHTATEINALRIYLEYNALGGGDDVWVDHMNITITRAGTDDYELDLEVKFIDANFTQANEELCIFAGTQGAEALTVEVWDGSWNQVISDLVQNNWNNVSVSTYLITGTLNIRFLDSDQAGDSTLTTWDIDYVILHCWNDTVYEIQWEHQAWSSPSSQGSYRIAVYGRVDNDAGEDIDIQIWNYTTNDWDNPILAVTGSTFDWYNTTINETSHLDSNGNTTWRYIGSSESSDTTQSTLEIDQAGVWYEEPGAPYVDFRIVADGNTSRDGVWGSEPFRYPTTMVPADQDVLSTDWWYGSGNTTYIFDFTVTWGDLDGQQIGLWRAGGGNTSIETISCASGAWRVYVYYTQNPNDKVTGHESGHATDALGNVTVDGLTTSADYWFKVEVDVGEGVLIDWGETYRGDMIYYAEGV